MFKTGRNAARIILPAIALLAVISLILTPSANINAAGETQNDLSFWRLIRDTDSIPTPTPVAPSQRVGFSVKLNLVKYQNASGNNAWIFNMDTGRFWFIDYMRKTFSEGAFDDLKKYYLKKYADEKVSVEAASANQVNPDANAQAELSKAIEQRLTLLDIGSQRLKVSSMGGEAITAGGYSGKPYTIKIGGNEIRKYWLTDDLPMPSSWRKFLDTMSEIDPVSWKIEAALPKFAVKSEYNYGGVNGGWDLQTMMVGIVSINEFLVPVNFAKTAFPPAK